MKIKTFEVKCLMADRDLNTIELAEVSGVSRNTISSVINGKSCSLSTAAKLAKALNAPLADIAEE